MREHRNILSGETDKKTAEILELHLRIGQLVQVNCEQAVLLTAQEAELLYRRAAANAEAEERSTKSRRGRGASRDGREKEREKKEKEEERVDVAVWDKFDDESSPVKKAILRVRLKPHLISFNYI